MKIKEEAQGIEEKLESICQDIECVIEAYEKYNAEYGWDNFSETLANAAAQLYMMRMMIHNAEVIRSR